MNSQSNKYMTLASDIVIFIIGTVFAKAIQFLLMPLYTTYLTTEEYGVAELTNNLSEFFLPIATLCIYEAAFRYAVDPSFDNRKIVATVIKVMSRSTFIGVFITIVANYLFHYQYAYYLFFILYSYSIRMCAAYYVRGKGFSKVFAMSGVVNALSLGLFNVIFLVILRCNDKGYLISIGLSYCCSALYLLIKGNAMKDYEREKSDKNAEIILLQYCIPLIFYNVLYWFTTISGRYILLWYTDSSITGKYVAAIKIAAVINMLQQAVYSAFQLNSSRVYNEDNRESFYSGIINSFISLYCVFGSIMICMTPLLARFTLRNEFYDASIYLPMILFSAIIYCVSSLLGTMYSTYKKTKRTVGVSLCGAIINGLFGVLLTPQHGIWGVCLASALCYSGQTVYKYFDIKMFCKIQYNWKIIIPNSVWLFSQVGIMSTDIKYKNIISLFIAFIMLVNNWKTILEAANQIVGKKSNISFRKG